MAPEVRESGLVTVPDRPPAGFGERSPREGQPEHRAAPPRAPETPPALLQQRAEHTGWLGERGALERRSMLRGLLMLALLVLAISLVRAGLGRSFPAGWWRQW